ncbi:MAG: YkgJ family cysteine cluster protein [Reyranellaceae bacterium]
MARPPSPPKSPRTFSARLKLAAGDLAIEATVAVPAEPVPATAMLPALRQAVDAAVAAAEARETDHGRSVSCKKGCSACCRQLVPISLVEAHAIRRLVDSLPPVRRHSLRKRFAAAAERLRAAGLHDLLRDPAKRADGETAALGKAYFALSLDCPFLEDHLCSVHQERPLVCREYLVTSPATFCDDPDGGGVVPVAAPKLSVALRGLGRGRSEAPADSAWIPLALALELAPDRHPETATGTAWLQRLFAGLQRGGDMNRPENE